MTSCIKMYPHPAFPELQRFAQNLLQEKERKRPVHNQWNYHSCDTGRDYQVQCREKG